MSILTTAAIVFAVIGGAGLLGLAGLWLLYWLEERAGGAKS